jgi:lipoprotein NlpI
MIDSILYRAVAMLIAVIGMLAGCAQPPERPSAEPIVSTAKREKLALDLQEKGELADALVQWNILSTIDPANDFYKKQARETRQVIDARCKSLLLEGIAHLNRGARDAARTSFLKALALNPRNKEAFNYLRQMSIQYPITTQNNAKPAGCCRNRNTM